MWGKIDRKAHKTVAAPRSRLRRIKWTARHRFSGTVDGIRSSSLHTFVEVRQPFSADQLINCPCDSSLKTAHSSQPRGHPLTMTNFWPVHRNPHMRQ